MSDDIYSRTVLFAQQAVRWPPPGPPSDHAVRSALQTHTIGVAVRDDLAHRVDVQLALLTLVNLVARYGCPVALGIQAVRVVIDHPLVPPGSQLDEALARLAADIHPAIRALTPPLLTCEFGATPGDRALGVTWTTWCGGAGRGCCPPHLDVGRALGPVVGAHLAAIEVFKALMRCLAGDLGASSGNLDRDLAAGEPRLSLLTYERELDDHNRDSGLPSLDLGETVFVSAGAITNAALSGLVSTRDLPGVGRVIDAGILDPPDLNRYSLALARDEGTPKAPLLRDRLRGVATLVPVPRRYEDVNLADRAGHIAVVGVDQVSSRSAVQRDWPEVLLCGATERDEIFGTVHLKASGLACCECLYPPDGLPTPGRVPTLAPVSGLAGLVLAAELLKIANPSLESLRLHNRLHLRALQLERRWNISVGQALPRQGCRCGRATRR